MIVREEWKAGDFAISRRRQPPIFFFRVVRVELVPGEVPILVPWWWCCARCEEVAPARGWTSCFFRHATRAEIRRLSRVDPCVYRNLPHERRVGRCTRRLEVELAASGVGEFSGAARSSPRR